MSGEKLSQQFQHCVLGLRFLRHIKNLEQKTLIFGVWSR